MSVADKPDPLAYMWGDGRAAQAMGLCAESIDGSPKKRALAADALVNVIGAVIEQCLPLMVQLGMAPDECVAAVAEEARDQAIGLLGWEPRRRSIAPRLRTIVFRRDGYVCVDCGEDDVFKLSIDHRIPVHFGGGNEPDNLVTRCRSCNAAKGTELRP